MNTLGALFDLVQAMQVQLDGLTREVTSLRNTLPPAPLVTVNEYCQLASVSKATAWRRAKSGAARTVKVGNSVRFDVSELRPVTAEIVSQLAAQARGGR